MYRAGNFQRSSTPGRQGASNSARRRTKEVQSVNVLARFGVRLGNGWGPNAARFGTQLGPNWDLIGTRVGPEWTRVDPIWTLFGLGFSKLGSRTATRKVHRNKDLNQRGWCNGTSKHLFFASADKPAMKLLCRSNARWAVNYSCSFV